MTDYITAAREASGVSEASILGEGQLCVAVLVPPKRVLRFPRHDFGGRRLQDALYGARQQEWSHVDDVLQWYEGQAGVGPRSGDGD